MQEGQGESPAVYPQMENARNNDLPMLRARGFINERSATSHLTKVSSPFVSGPRRGGCRKLAMIPAPTAPRASLVPKAIVGNGGGFNLVNYDEEDVGPLGHVRKR